MDFGLTMFVTDETIDPVTLAKAAEDAGFESLFVPEHTHIPTSRATPFPGGGDLPREYSRTYDPFVTLAAVAAVTERLKIGTGVCLVVQRDPIITAKEVATLDRLSGGRFLFGVGAGWNREEMANHGTDPGSRFSLLVERVAAMQQIWTAEEASFHGRFVDFDPVWSWPKPLQRPYPPVLVGGGGPTVLDRVLAVGDGWLPIGRDVDDRFADRVAELRWRADEAGRDVSVSLFGAKPTAEAMERAAEAGVDRCIFWLPPAAEDAVLERVQRYGHLIRGH